MLPEISKAENSCSAYLIAVVAVHGQGTSFTLSMHRTAMLPNYPSFMYKTKTAPESGDKDHEESKQRQSV